MPRFFVDKKDILEDEIKITGDNYRHLTGVLRAKIGDEIEVCNGEKRDYLCKIISINSECVIANVLSDFVSVGEPKCNITLLMAMPKGDKAELIIEKATELGVFKIVFFISKFCVSRPSEKDFLKKQIRYKKVAESAAKQSKRGIVPEILFLDSIKKAVNFTDVDNDKIIFYEGKASPIKEVLKN
ncbi:MAG: RsmE family RNA methyltransferase, partial [Clostridia bacterium]